MDNGRFGWKHALLIAAVIGGGVLAWAWFDGGVEPVRPMTAEAFVPDYR